MRKLFCFLTTLLPLFSANTLSAQVPIGQWRDQLPYSRVNAVTDAGHRIYASTPFAVFYLNREDNSIGRITRISGLSDIGISAIQYNRDYSTLVVAYTNANIDLIKEGKIINISDIKRKSILGNKTINHIYFIGKYAYLSTGFGIVVLDIVREEIRETYYIGPNGSQVNVLSLTRDNRDTLYAATEKGVYRANLNDPNLSNFASWRKEERIDTGSSYNTITFFAGRVVVNKRAPGSATDTLYSYDGNSWNRFPLKNYTTILQLRSNDDHLIITCSYYVLIYNTALQEHLTIWDYQPGAPFPLDAMEDAEKTYWVGDTYSGLIRYEPSQGYTRINLGGPATSLAFSMAGAKNNVYIAPGGRDASFIPLFTQPQVYHFNNSDWYNLGAYNNPVLGQTHDIVALAVNPSNPGHVFAASYGKGVVEILNDSAIRRYTEKNSTLKHHTSSDTSDIRVGGLTFDSKGNLWIVNSHNNSCISRKTGDQWTGYTVPIVNENDLGMIMADRHGQKWIQMRYGNMNPNSLLVFRENDKSNNPADYQAKLLNSSVGSGNIPGNNVFAIAEDKNGEIWIGTEKGIAVFYNPEDVFSGRNFDCQRILVSQGGYVQYLLENETVTAIAVDGANRKWLGTDRGGVFLFSEDGTKQIYHFTTENSPLLSDRITCMTISQDGEVFFGTDKGVISFRSSATPANDEFGDVYAFPNPVKPGYEGYIAIKGLVSNAQVRITDVNGVTVYSTRAEGGQAVWDGRNFDGRRADTGVYLVFAANDDASEKIVTRILFVR